MHAKTQYEDVNRVLSLLIEGLVKLLGDQLVGVYLTGSLTYGDFSHGSSDIDFLAVLSKELNEEQLNKVTELHRQIAEAVPFWAKRLEGSYITRQSLQSAQAPKQDRPYVNGGKVSYATYGNEWIINLYALQECGETLYGVSLEGLVPQVTIEQVREASKDDLTKEWLPKLKDPNAFSHSMYDSEHIKNYAVLTMCRILHRAKNDSIASKKVASAWVKETYPEWKDLVERAEKWQHGDQMATSEDVKQFIRFTKDTV